MTKTTPIFLLFSVITLSLIGNAFAFTDQELTDKYRGATETDTLANIQNAINDHSLQCSDLPSTILAQGCPDTPQPSTTGGSNTYYAQTTPPSQTSQDVSPAPITINTTQQTGDNSSFILVAVTPVMIAVFFILRYILTRHVVDDYDDSSPKPKQPSKLLRYSPFHKKVIGSVKTETSPDLATLDNAIEEHDYSNKGMFNDAEIAQVHQRMVKSHKMRSLPTSHKLLFSFGLMKEKKK